MWGHDLLGGFGPFEALDLGAAAGIEVVLTTFAVGLPAVDLGDLVEYYM